MSKYKFRQVAIPDFIFTDGSKGVFNGFDRGSYPCDGVDYPHWVWQMGLFDSSGNYFSIKIDTRKKSLSKKVTFILDGETFYHPITDFYTIGCKINPANGHSLPHNGCAECRYVDDSLKTFELLDLKLAAQLADIEFSDRILH